ncbi:MAG TPA: zinc-binding dehydrogenase [Candidatus Binatia bacterium]|nr:zinc-binding dehydrogenase [Candidatus Binatia bacterium]
MESRTAVINDLNGELEIRTVAVPELLPGSVLIRVDAATLCGTDAHRWQGHLAAKDTPFVPGHETCGTIVDLNADAYSLLNEPLGVGDRIVSSYSHCGHCFYCRIARQTTLCEHNTMYGAWAPEKLMGGCADYHLFPPGASFVKVPDNVSSPLAASSACALRTVFHGYEQLGAIPSWESALILGAGPLGLYATAVARDRGAKRVFTIGAPAARLDVARAWGADDTLDLDRMKSVEDRVRWVRERTGGRGADFVMNCASSAAFIEALQMCRPGGRVVNIGVSGGPPLSLPAELLFRGISIKTIVMAEARHFYEAIDFLATRQDEFPFEKLLSNTFPLAGTTQALRGMADFREIKPVIVPSLN